MTCKWSFRKNVRLINNEQLQKIIQFYVLNTPVPDISKKGITFDQLGWSEGSYNSLHAKMREVSGFPSADGSNWIQATVREIPSILKKLDRLESFDCTFEFAVHTVKTTLNKTQALFYLIRNSLAHGSFRICDYEGTRFYVLESMDGGSLKGRAILREASLLQWIKIVKKGSKSKE